MKALEARAEAEASTAVEDVQLAEEGMALGEAGATTIGRPHPAKLRTKEAVEDEAASQSKAEVDATSPTTR